MIQESRLPPEQHQSLSSLLFLEHVLTELNFLPTTPRHRPTKQKFSALKTDISIKTFQYIRAIHSHSPNTNILPSNTHIHHEQSQNVGHPFRRLSGLHLRLVLLGPRAPLSYPLPALRSRLYCRHGPLYHFRVRTCVFYRLRRYRGLGPWLDLGRQGDSGN